MNISERKPIWIALSEFYLDTELEQKDFKRIALKMIESPFSLEEIKNINKYEVFPVLQANLSNIAGEWAGFDEKWLEESIVKSIEKRNYFRKLSIEFSYFINSWMCKKHWINTEKEYKKIKTTAVLRN
ncbi:DUF7079 family protein [Flavobacterium cerinum]|uniref:DUF7079 domain-containing protein n=1 Tax=Flavobacterium cerinum TaxID=2502784 RepID=A0ABY5IPI8_9FLAO|nr:hypothetical protein [Flavobacterium cerinum]UUC44753.1 hypothetical protein NOX80_14080 [Flavobacterium cerinum]